jgi:hypothetical protein
MMKDQTITQDEEKKARQQMRQLLHTIIQERCHGDHAASSTSSDILEKLLFTSASNMDEYMDLTGIESKIKGLSMRILRRRLQKRQRRIGGFRSNMVVVLMSSRGEEPMKTAAV